MNIEAPDNAIAYLRLPCAVRPLAKLITHLSDLHGDHLSMKEEPEGWLVFFKPERAGVPALPSKPLPSAH